MERIHAIIDLILQRSKMDAEISQLPAAYTDGRGPPAMVSAVEDIHRTMDIATIIVRNIDLMNELVEELKKEIHLLRDSL